MASNTHINVTNLQQSIADYVAMSLAPGIFSLVLVTWVLGQSTSPTVLVFIYSWQFKLSDRKQQKSKFETYQ